MFSVHNGCDETQFQQFGIATAEEVASQTSGELLSLDNLLDFL